MKTILRAEEFISQYELGNTGKVDIQDAQEALIEFAKLHVQAALKEASEKVKMKDINEDCHYEDEDGNYPEIMVFDRDAILNAYPLNNIK